MSVSLNDPKVECRVSKDAQNVTEPHVQVLSLRFWYYLYNLFPLFHSLPSSLPSPSSALLPSSAFLSSSAFVSSSAFLSSSALLPSSPSHLPLSPPPLPPLSSTAEFREHPQDTMATLGDANIRLHCSTVDGRLFIWEHYLLNGTRWTIRDNRFQSLR